MNNNNKQTKNKGVPMIKSDIFKNEKKKIYFKIKLFIMHLSFAFITIYIYTGIIIIIWLKEK